MLVIVRFMSSVDEEDAGNGNGNSNYYVVGECIWYMGLL